RRMAGLLRARLPELDLEEVPDPRVRGGRWDLSQILRATLLGLMAGCRSLWEAEQLTEGLAPTMRRRLGLPRRLADTTARDALCRVSLDGLRAVLHRAVRAAWRRKALAPVGLPVSVVALDGKATSLPCINGEFAQTQHPEQGLPYGIIRTMTCALVSAAGRPCIDAVPIPASTNEVGHFETAFRSLVATYGSLFDVITYDAGGFSRANADSVVAADKDYLFAMKDEQRTMCRLADEMLAFEKVVARTEDVLDNETTVVRSLKLLRADPSWSYGDGKTPEESVWPHAKAFLSVEYVKVRVGAVVARDERMFVSSYDPTRLTPAQWLLLVRSHWGVENQNHHTLDTAFAEDDRPWIEADEHGMLAVLLLRRIAYTVLALFRAASRTDEGRAIRWRALLAWVRDALVAATEDQFAELREIAAATR
ncbi:MAG TPA: ISAs1 family transposase, partial [Anaeromyxobacteraceae bacterium]|nr:ISAs1 family transposase [Anaeromyxobacteraceae bacterium]